MKTLIAFALILASSSSFASTVTCSLSSNNGSSSNSALISHPNGNTDVTAVRDGFKCSADVTLETDPTVAGLGLEIALITPDGKSVSPGASAVPQSVLSIQIQDSATKQSVLCECKIQ